MLEPANIYFQTTIIYSFELFDEGAGKNQGKLNSQAQTRRTGKKQKSS